MNEMKISTRTFSKFIIAATLSLLALGTVRAGSGDDQKLATANNGFAFKLLTRLNKDQTGSNIFVSPYSASSALQMVANGAAGQTKTELQQTLGTTGLQPAALNEANKAVNESLNSQGTNVVLTTANAIWYQKGTSVKPEFTAVNQQFFGATFDPLDFADPRSVDVMNAWAKDKTQGRIDRIADGMVDRATRMFLANAVYFKGKWQVPFDVKNTKERPFHLRTGREKNIPMMEQSRKFSYRQGTGYQSVRLPYQGGNLAMYVILPDSSSSPERLLSVLTGDMWQRVVKPGFKDQEGTVVLPKFKLEYGVELKQPLIILGIRAAFDTARADFSGIAREPLFISAVRQKTFVEVNEEGTEAAAVTGIAVGVASIEMNPPKPFEMIADHPFLFLIEDQQTGTILFMGAVFDPPSASSGVAP